MVKGDFKPFGVAFGMAFHVGSDVDRVHIFPGLHFFGVDDGGCVGLSEPHMVELMFDEAESDGGFINKGEDLVHLAVHTHFFLKSSCGGLFKGFAVAGVAATGVGPEAGGMVLGECSLLEKQLAF